MGTRQKRVGDRESRDASALRFPARCMPVHDPNQQARIALLEGQRRSAENLKLDLLRRVKMLEYALRQERSVSSGH